HASTSVSSYCLIPSVLHLVPSFFIVPTAAPEIYTLSLHDALPILEKIEAQIDLSSEPDIDVKPAQGATRLDGEAGDIFRILEKAFSNVSESVGHTAMAFTISANSPSDKG